MTELQEALLAGLMAATRETEGLFIIYLTDGRVLTARPLGLTGRSGSRLLLRLADAHVLSLSARLLDGFAPAPEAMLSGLPEERSQ